MQSLGRNRGGYFGERLPLARTLERIHAAASLHHWRTTDSPRPLLEARSVPFLAFHRPSAREEFRLYFSAGIHGDEPAGPLAAAQVLEENEWPADVALWSCPCLNPTGFQSGSRTNDLGVDLNRDYRIFRSEEARRHAAWLQHQPRFDLGICLHEDWEAKGFYLYEVNPDFKPSLAPAILERVAKVCPIDRSSNIDGWPAENGIVRPQFDPRERPEWAESPFLLVNRTRLSYTFEAPSDFPLETRVRALTVAIRAAIEYSRPLAAGSAS